MTRHGFLLILLLTQFLSLRPLLKFATLPLAGVWVVAASVGLWLLWHPPQRLRPWLNTAWPFALLVTVLAVAVAVGYPLADGLKHTGRGSDADDAILQVAHSLLAFANPYLHGTYFGNPLSPGALWGGVFAPLAACCNSLTGLYPLAILAALAYAAWQTCRLGGWLAVNQRTFSLFSCLLVWELSVVGNDMLVWGILFAGLATQLTAPSASLRTPSSAITTAALALAVGILANARIVLGYLPLLVGFAGFHHARAQAIAIALGGTLLATAGHLVMWQLNPQAYTNFGPLHLLHKGAGAAGGYGMALAAVCGVTGLLMLANWRRWHPLTHLTLGVAIPLGGVSLTSLFTQYQGNLSLWEGATFFMPALPLVIAWASTPAHPANSAGSGGH